MVSVELLWSSVMISPEVPPPTPPPPPLLSASCLHIEAKAFVKEKQQEKIHYIRVYRCAVMQP